MATAEKKYTDRNELADTNRLIEELADIRRDILAYAGKMEELTECVNPEFRDSAVNLIHYLALRHRDLRRIQSRLALMGLSSLGRSESHVLANIDAVLKTLNKLADRPYQTPQERLSTEFSKGPELLKRHTDMLLGPAPDERAVRIMVTMPSQAAEDYALVRDLIENGMDCVRINCAHDDRASWEKMIANTKKASVELGRPCRILMDLAGPKLRTGPIEPGEKVMKIKPERDAAGRVVKPATVILKSGSKKVLDAQKNRPGLKVPLKWLRGLKKGERISFKDASGSIKSLVVRSADEFFCETETKDTCYITPGTVLSYPSLKGKRKKASVGDMPSLPSFIPLSRGDMLMLRRGAALGRPALKDARGVITTPAEIGCTLSEVLNDVRVGEEIFFDDGKIGGIIESVERKGVGIRITLGRDKAKLRADKGINLPTSDLRLPCLTKKDIEDLDFIADNADMVALSFARRASDIDELISRISSSGRKVPAVIIKVETRTGLENLPAMMLSAMATPCCGVMIARGDLAIECGFERLAEVQEEILWLSEAAHVPVIWATQVLENMARDGIPSRAEITDAAMSNRAECVMLNKGPYIVNTVKTLVNILKRMEGHQSKKQAMLRELKLAGTLTMI